MNDSVEDNPKIIKIGLLGFNGDWVTNSMGVQLGLEAGFRENKSFEWDLSYIFKMDKGELFDINVDDIHGIKLNSELRSYFSKNSNPRITGFYWAPAMVFQYTRSKRSQTLDYGDQNVYYVNRYFSAINLKVGIQTPILKNLIFDVAIGAGLQYISSNSVNKKTGYTNENEIFDKQYDSGSKWFPGPAMSLNIGYRF